MDWPGRRQKPSSRLRCHLMDDQRRLQIWAKDLSWTDAGTEHCHLADKHHIGDLSVCVGVCMCIYVWVCFVGISTALPMFSYLWGKFIYIIFPFLFVIVFLFHHKRFLTACILLLRIPQMYVRVYLKLTLSLCEWFFFRKRNSVNILLFGYRCTCTWVNVVMPLRCIVFTYSLFCKLTR